MRGLVTVALTLTACGPGAQRHATIAAEPSSGYLTVPGGRIYFETAGQGPAVVLIHGGFGDRRMWDAQFTELARSFQVVRYDHRGFGNSTALDSAYSPARDLLGLLDSLDIPRAHIIGNSVGGSVALDFAVLHPERVSKVVVVASGLWLQNPMVAVASEHPRNADLVRRMVNDNRNIFLLQHWPE